MKIEDKDKVIRDLAELRYKKGWSRTSLVDMLKSKYGLNDSRAYELVREMMDKTAAAYHEMNRDALADSISFMEEMKQKAVGQGNDKMALEWAKELHKVSQLHVQKIELEAKNIEGINITIKKDRDE